jgi:hypothetical protein
MVVWNEFTNTKGTQNFIQPSRIIKHFKWWPKDGFTNIKNVQFFAQTCQTKSISNGGLKMDLQTQKKNFNSYLDLCKTRKHLQLIMT